MKQSQKKILGKEAFYSYYASIFGERWQTLEKALLLEPCYCSILFEGAKPYFLDAGSVCAALTLPVKNAASVLDVCAAPGGKSLVLASNLSPKAHLLCNERSPERTARLSKVIEDSLPASIGQRVGISTKDGSSLCRTQNECFDCILLDAPCSSERHVLKSPVHLNRWSPSRTKHIAIEQWALLSSSWRLLSLGGFLLYATCALSPKENDGVVVRLKKKFGGSVRKASLKEMYDTFSQNLCTCPVKSGENSPPLTAIFSRCEETEEGLMLLPDKSFAGPLYFSLFQKVERYATLQSSF